MHIKEVDLRNFKSFGKRVQISLRNDFTVVTGPNGSGKSNIIDALLFSLCLSSSRAMRAEKLPDLIYKGENGKNPDFTQVTVRLDNTSRIVPADLDTVEITRKIKLHKGKAVSSYYFCGKPCSYGELQDHLGKAGISPESYNVVMQGDVTRIIEMSPTERRKIVDEIAGVAEFDEKKRKSLEELDIVRERIGRIDIILEEVGSHLSKLLVERDKALAYEAYRDELRRLEASLLLAKLKESSDKLAALESEKVDLANQVMKFNSRSQARKAELSSLEERLKSLNSEINKKGEDEDVQVRRRIVELKGEVARDEGRAEVAENALASADDQLKACFIQQNRLQQEEQENSEKIRDGSIRGASLRGELDDQEKALSEARARIAEADAQYSQLRDELSLAIKLREEAKGGLGDLVRERDRLLDLVRRSTSEREELAAAISEITASIEGMDKEAEQLKTELAELNGRALVMEKDRDDMESARLRIRREMADTDRELQRLQGEYAKVDVRLRSIDDRSGYSRAVDSIRSAMKRQMLSGLFGTISELGNVSPRYSTALEVAAGARLQSVVADTDQDASVAIDYLKRTQAGRATFLPLNKMESGSLPPKPNWPGVVDYALNLIDFNPKFFSAFWHVFRDTLVVEGISTARQLMGRYRMVTLEGDLVEKSGAMTGGHYKSRLKFAADEGNKLLELSGRISKAEAERSSRLDTLDEMEGEISKLSKEIEELDKAISKKTFRLDELQASEPRSEKAIKDKKDRLAQIEAGAKDAREGLDLLEGDIQKFEEDLAQAQLKIAQLEKALAGSDIPELIAKAEAAESEIKRLKERTSEIDAEILKYGIISESNSEKQRELAKKRENLEAQKAEALERKKSSVTNILDLKAEIKACEVKANEIDTELHGLKGAKSQIVEGILSAQRDVDQAERDRDRAGARLTAAEAASAEIRAEVQGLRAEIEACGVDPNQEPPQSDVVAGKIRATEQAMKNLEPVNMLAIGEYDMVDNRMKNLQTRRETLHREREAIIDKLDRYEQLKKESFMVSFEEINKNFKEIFKELSNGDGDLILEDPEDPLSGGMTIRARPAGKPFHRLEAMSGGEKSLTALSFIFAIQKHKPAPFYAMDEIDMFLDGVNAERVAKLIKKISKNAQFIVVSLRKPMIQQAKYTIGVTMQENNISSATGICLS